MSATATGDRPKRIRAKPPDTKIEDMNIPIGERVATLETNYRNMEAALTDTKAISLENGRKLDTLLIRTAVEDGVDQYRNESKKETKADGRAKQGVIIGIAGAIGGVISSVGSSAWTHFFK